MFGTKRDVESDSVKLHRGQAQARLPKMPGIAAEALGIAEIVDMVLSCLNTPVSEETNMPGRLCKRVVHPSWSSARSLNRLWKREVDRRLVRELASDGISWQEAYEWPVRRGAFACERD